MNQHLSTRSTTAKTNDLKIVANIDNEVKKTSHLPGENSILHMDSSYNDNSACQAYAASILAELLGHAAKKVNSSLPEGVHFNVCEYGCATGGSSIIPLKAIENNTSKDRPIDVTMVDLPNNDWHVLKATVESAFPMMEFGYKATSMYEPISKEGSVHLAYSCFAQHWLSGGAPTRTLPNGAIWANQLDSEDESRKRWEAASKQDWETLLAQRAKEVASGGMMCFHIQSATAAGGLSEAFASVLQQVKLDMVKSGELPEKLAQTMVMPEYCKSPIEIVAPLSSSPNDLLWDLESIQYCKIPCAYIEEYHAKGGCMNTPNHEEKKGEDDQHLVYLGKEIVKKEIGFLRAFMDSSIVASIGTAKTDMFWANVEHRVGNDPELLSAAWMGTFIVLRRTEVHCE